MRVATRVLISIVATTSVWVSASAEAADPRARVEGLGDSEKVRATYAVWAARHERADDHTLTLSLGWSKGLSVERTSAVARLTLDPVGGEVSVEAWGLDPARRWDVWIVDNLPGPGRSVLIDAGDERVLLGSLEPAGDALRLERSLGRAALNDFQVDLAVVVRGGEDPVAAAVLFGMPTLFDRLRSGQAGATAGEIDRLVSLGEALFQNETFDGNGRTCASCHPLLNNFTLDPQFIATLPAGDPLFVAEQNPALSENFENPVLMREFGLILENPDGFGDLENDFVMRSVPHMLAMSQSITPSYFDSTGGGDVPPFERTGWAGDGAPGGGTLREFALGAVTQHFTRTLGRVPGVDFRLPTDLELDAIEAFTLSLGRQADPDLAALRLADPVDQAGRSLFLGNADCFECHSNGGANADFVDLGGNQNVNFDTGVQNVVHPAELIGQPLPPDGGFGRDPHPGGGYGDGKFNTPPVIEAADTAPFFHHHSAATLEEAIAFYASDEFNSSPAGIFVNGITLTEEEVFQIAAFLRTLNALENIRSAMDAAAKAKETSPAVGLLRLCVTEVVDAVGVLQEGSHHLPAIPFLRSAAASAGAANAADNLPERTARIDRALADLRRARRVIQGLRNEAVEEGAPVAQAADGIPTLRVVRNPAAGMHEFVVETRRPEAVTLEVFDVRGRRVAVPFTGELGEGTQRLRWSGRAEDGSLVFSGVYFARVKTPSGAQSVRFVHTIR